MLEKLAKRNDDWRNLAYRICGDYDLRSRLSTANVPKTRRLYEVVNDAMVAITIKNLCGLDLLKKKNREVRYRWLSLYFR